MVQTSWQTGSIKKVKFITIMDYRKEDIDKSESEINQFLASHSVESIQVVPGYGYGTGVDMNSSYPRVMIVYTEATYE